MPVFHTKTIESILEPVAQQVSDIIWSRLYEIVVGGACGTSLGFSKSWLLRLTTQLDDFKFYAVFNSISVI